MTFQPFTLCQLYDQYGSNRTAGENGSSAEIEPHRLHPHSREKKSQTRRLLAQIRHECELRETGWKCLIGWAVKAGRPVDIVTQAE